MRRKVFVVDRTKLVLVTFRMEHSLMSLGLCVPQQGLLRNNWGTPYGKLE